MTKETAATKTEITGKDYKTCTGTLNNHTKAKFAVGQKVGLKVTMDCDDGGELTGYRTAVIERIAEGTEYGMYGTTALVQLTLQINSYNEGVRKVLVAARHLDPK